MNDQNRGDKLNQYILCNTIRNDSVNYDIYRQLLTKFILIALKSPHIMT